MKLDQYFDSQTPERAALTNLVLTLLQEVKHHHIDYFADTETEHMSYERWIEVHGLPKPGTKSLRDYSLQNQSRISKITSFTVAINLPEVHEWLIESIRWALCYEGVQDVLVGTPFLFREANSQFYRKLRIRCEEAGLGWL